MLDICFLTAIGQSTRHHDAQVTDSGECMTETNCLEVYYTDYDLVYQTTKSI